LVIFLLVVTLISLLIAHVISITSIWNTILLRPMLNFLVLVSHYLLGSFGIAIIVLTIIIRLLMFPLSMRQLRSSKAMQLIQPELKQLQQRYAEDRAGLGRETMKLYREAGIKPVGCASSILMQMPIWVALYQSGVQALAYTPENLFGLAKQLYSPMVFQQAVPINHHFLWLDLTQGNLVMALLVAGSVWMLGRMAQTPAAAAHKGFMNRVMLWVLPLFFGFFAFTLPSVLSLYWVTSNIIGIILQYSVTGWGSLKMPSMSFQNRNVSRPVNRPPAKTGGAGGKGKKGGRTVVEQESAAHADRSSHEEGAAAGNMTPQQKKESPENFECENKD
jgi:YidC/Oxa1 family membrane protein insertase